MLKKWATYIAYTLIITPLLLISMIKAKSNQVGFSDYSQILSDSPHLKPQVLKLGLKAYQCAIKKNLDRQHLLTIIDYSMPSSKKRMWVIDVDHNRTLFHTYVSHGQGNGNLYATRFSNQFGSHATSIGLYRTGHTYIGHRGYSLRLHGLEKGFNNNAYKRLVVMHPAWYARHQMIDKYGRLGRSWGCPALSPQISKKVIHTIKDGTLVFAYYPNARWLHKSQYLNCSS